MKYINKIFFIFILFSLIFAATIPVFAADVAAKPAQPICAVYLTGNGCSNCATIDPLLLWDVVLANPELIILEYEIYHAANENKTISDLYFKNYFAGQPTGVPTLILSQDKKAVGRIKIAEFLQQPDALTPSACPLPDGSSVDFSAIDLAQLKGRITIWTKNRVLFSTGPGGDNTVLKKVLLAQDLWSVLKDLSAQTVDPVPVEISQNAMIFQRAVRLGNWVLQWNDYTQPVTKKTEFALEKIIPWIFIVFMTVFILVLFVRVKKTENGFSFELRDIEKKHKDYLLIGLVMVGVIAFFIFAKAVSPVAIEKAGYALPLPIFTLIIGLLDGFNPCNMFVLTCLMALLVSTSHSKLRLYVVGISFVLTCFILYFLFMAAWLNVFQFVRFVTPLRIGIGILALVAGFINCKELLFFKKGVSLTIPDEQRGFLMRKMYTMKKAIQQGSFPILIWASFALAILSSLVEIPCTAGFPIIYTGILSGKTLDSNFSYYAYLVFYNVLYVLPLLTIVSVFVMTFKGQPISQRQMEILKFVGGVIMILLGIILLVNPGLIGLHFG